MKVKNIEDINKTKKKLVLEIEPQDMEQEREEAYEELEKQAVLPGFRPGKVPRKMLVWRFDKEIRKEAFAEAVQKAYETAIEENHLHVVGEPDIDKEALEKGQEQIVDSPVEIEVSVEFVPEFEVAPYTGQTLEVERFEVSDEDVERVIEEDRKRHAYFKSVVDRKVQKGDFLVVDLTTTRDGEEVPGMSSKQTLLGPLCEDDEPSEFQKAFLGREKGERFEFDFELPENHPLRSDEKSNRVHVEAKVHTINERTLPELDDDFAKDRGFDSLDAMRTQIREMLEKNRDEAMESKKRSTVIEHLLDHTEIDLPASLIESTYNEISLQRTMEDYRAGLDPDRFSSEEKFKIETETMFEAERAIKNDLILDKIAEKEEIEVTDDDYYEAMAKRAQKHGETNLDRFLARIDRQGLEDQYRRIVRREKVLDWLVKNNEFQEKSVEASKE